eukprot:GHVT01061461.1.p1 GENE.GHVT01061461.1~~GHVT01061461.1.p1  ORF type:complete len:462 (-),score=78.95 GHVT01061461.1:486-1871(-)
MRPSPYVSAFLRVALLLLNPTAVCALLVQWPRGGTVEDAHGNVWSADRRRHCVFRSRRVLDSAGKGYFVGAPVVGQCDTAGYFDSPIPSQSLLDEPMGVAVDIATRPARSKRNPESHDPIAASWTKASSFEPLTSADADEAVAVVYIADSGNHAIRRAVVPLGTAIEPQQEDETSLDALASGGPKQQLLANQTASFSSIYFNSTEFTHTSGHSSEKHTNHTSLPTPKPENAHYTTWFSYFNTTNNPPKNIESPDTTTAPLSSPDPSPSLLAPNPSLTATVEASGGSFHSDALPHDSWTALTELQTRSAQSEELLLTAGVTTVAGGPRMNGLADGHATVARLHHPTSVALAADRHTLLFIDNTNRLRQLNLLRHEVKTVSGNACASSTSNRGTRRSAACCSSSSSGRLVFPPRHAVPTCPNFIFLFAQPSHRRGPRGGGGQAGRGGVGAKGGRRKREKNKGK